MEGGSCSKSSSSPSALDADAGGVLGETPCCCSETDTLGEEEEAWTRREAEEELSLKSMVRRSADWDGKIQIMLQWGVVVVIS